MPIERKTEYTITFTAVGQPEPTTPDRVLVRAGEPFAVQLAAAGGAPPYRYLPGNLPPGVSLTEAGALTGVIVLVGEVPITYYIADTLD
jgi:hypothetical protein